MKKLLLITLIGTFSVAGFFGDPAQEQALKEKREKERLCNFYQDKLDEYAKLKEKDELANATYLSYEKRIARLCPTDPKS